FGGRVWQAIGERHRVTVLSARSGEERHRRLNDMLFELGLSHLIVLDKAEVKRRVPAVFAEGSLGLAVRYLEDRAVVTDVRPKSSAAAAGLRPGFVIQRIGRQAVADLVKRSEGDLTPPFNPANRLNRLSSDLLGKLDGKPGSLVTLRYVDGEGVQREATLKRRPRGQSQVFSAALPPFYVEFSARRLQGGVAYVRFNHFAPPVDKGFADIVRQAAEAPGLIIDLRGNPGGFLKIAHSMASHLLTAPTLFSTLKLRDKKVEVTLKPATRRYGGPVVVLVDALSLSTSEYFAGCLQALGRVLVIGQQTPGFMLAANWKTLPDGASFMHTIGEPRAADGTLFEGRGVIPDVTVPLERKVLLAGDATLAAALHFIKSKAKSGG
ncbi:MAG: S41 family peptidase, partial [Alphaproteobacteria bacterium]|nr:S41 family peptidase [Alphaproteobacteria bacterium]